MFLPRIKISCTFLLFLATSLIMNLAPAISFSQDFNHTNLDPKWPGYDVVPFQFTGSRILAINFKTDPSILQALVPEPMVANSAGEITLVVAQHKITSPVQEVYNEAFLSVPAMLDSVNGDYLPVLYLNKAAPIIYGREISGFRKIDAQIDIEEAEGIVRATVVRDEATLISVEARLTMQIPQIPPIPSRPVFCLKYIPGCNGETPDVMELTSVITEDMKVHELHAAQAEFTFGSTEMDPLGEIPVRQITNAWFLVQDFLMNSGGMKHDYLAAE